MDETADDGREKRGARGPADLYLDAPELLSRLHREIELLLQVAPPEYEQLIAGLTDAMDAIGDAIERAASVTKRY
jgi:hypothetical protein